MSLQEFSSRMSKVNSNYKNHKNEWSFSVKQKNNVFTISARNKNRFISTNRGNFEELMKVMKIEVIEQENNLLLKKSFTYNPSHFLMIILFPYISYFLLLFIGLYISLSFLFNINIPFWIAYSEFIIGIVALTEFIWTKGSKKLEKERYQIIEEIYQRFFCE
jgi:hypothetical protein